MRVIIILQSTAPRIIIGFQNPHRIVISIGTFVMGHVQRFPCHFFLFLFYYLCPQGQDNFTARERAILYMIFQIPFFVFILIYMLYISWAEIFCTIYIKMSFMLVYSYKHSLDLSLRFSAFMHSLLELSASDLVICQGRTLLLPCTRKYLYGV